jgi:formylglycine-generating enzyme required for sulfatase activity
MWRLWLWIAGLLALDLLLPLANRADDPGFRAPNPRFVRQRDAKLNQEFDYVVYNLGKGVELKLVKVPAKGKTFVIGSPKQEKGHQGGEEQRDITFTDDYYLSLYEVTVSQFRRFVEETGYKTELEEGRGGWGWNERARQLEGFDQRYSWKNPGFPQSPQHPVVNISWGDAKRFCEWLAKLGDGRVRPRQGRLPGEAEWEYACRAGSRGRFFFGEDEEAMARYGNIADGSLRAKVAQLVLAPKEGSGRPGLLMVDQYAIQTKDGYAFTAPVGSYLPNAFGLYDMHGNVWEWCEDWYGSYADLPPEDNQVQRTRPPEGLHVIRGGSWSYKPQTCRSAARSVVPADSRGYYGFGLRVAILP